MAEDKKINILLENEKYFSELNKMLEAALKVRRFKRQLDDYEKEVLWFVGKETNYLYPDYTGFYLHAGEKVTSEFDDNTVHDFYKSLLGECSLDKLPGFDVYLLLLVKALNELRELSVNYEDENDLAKLKEDELREIQILHNKYKLLYGFVLKFDKVCGAYIDSFEIEELEYLDDGIKEADPDNIKHRLMQALQDRDRSMSLKLVGRLREVDSGEDYYLEALAHYIDNDYNECIRYIDKIEKSDIDYRSALALKLECCANSGNLELFNKCIKENASLKFNYCHYSYLLMRLMLNLENYSELSEDYEMPDNIDVTEDYYYYGKIILLVADMIVEGMSLIEEHIYLCETSEESKIIDSLEERIMQLWNTLIFVPGDAVKELDMLFNPDYIDEKGLDAIKEEAEIGILHLLCDNNHDPNVARHSKYLKKAIMCQLKLGDSDGFLESINHNFDSFLDGANNGDANFDELLRTAYVESMAIGKCQERLSNYIEKNSDKGILEDVIDKKILLILSDKGKTAYESAEWQFAKSKEEDYGWKDAGMISLGFYRILEVELNVKIIIPLLSKIGAKTLEDEFNSVKKQIENKDDRNDYIGKWKKNLDTYRKMEENDFNENGFMLGPMNYFFRAIGSDFKSDDGVAVLIKDTMKEVFTDQGVELFDQGFFEKMTCYETREKYRNPPAHTQYLPYDVACECRDYFRECILQFENILL